MRSAWLVAHRAVSDRLSVYARSQSGTGQKGNVDAMIEVWFH